MDKLINDIMSRKLLVPRLFSFTKTGSCSISRAGMWTLDRLRFRLGSHVCECAGVSALTVRTYSVKANIQTEKKMRRGISGQPVLILNHQHRGQNQSRCDSITNEGQITGMSGRQRRGGGEGRASQPGGRREDEIWRRGWGEETGGGFGREANLRRRGLPLMKGRWRRRGHCGAAPQPSCNWGGEERRSDVNTEPSPSSHHSGLWHER